MHTNFSNSEWIFYIQSIQQNHSTYFNRIFPLADASILRYSDPRSKAFLAAATAISTSALTQKKINVNIYIVMEIESERAKFNALLPYRLQQHEQSVCRWQGSKLQTFCRKQHLQTYCWWTTRNGQSKQPSMLAIRTTHLWIN